MGLELLGIWLLCGVISSIIASNKGNSSFLWFILGCVFGPLGLILALVVGNNQEAVERSAIESGTMKKCPYCAEIIKIEAIKCRFCGTDLPDNPQPIPVTDWYERNIKHK